MDYDTEMAELTLSLDVIFHLIEDEVFIDYMEKLFKASSKYVIIYSSNTNTQFNSPTKHFKNRKFTKWVNEKQPDFKLIKFIKNKYPYKKLNGGSLSNFFIYQKL